MEFRLKYQKSSDTYFGVFVESSAMQVWIEIASQLDRSELTFFPIPGLTANTVIGALIVSTTEIKEIPAGHLGVTRRGKDFYLPANAQLWPRLSLKNLNEYFQSPHLFHPVYGLIELQEIKDWSAYLQTHESPVSAKKPEDSFERPEKLGSYYIREVDPEDTIASLIKESVPESKSMESKPLTSWEKVKMRMLRATVGRKKVDDTDEKAGNNAQEVPTSNTGTNRNREEIPEAKQSWWKRKKSAWQDELESLEERNKNEIDKLLKMLNDDPDEALKYALPIDRSSGSRGPEVGFTMTQRWSNGRSLAGSGAGGSVNLQDDKTENLRTKYNNLAQQYIEDQKWEKASFVYMELLNDPYRAANTLKQGERYDAAAAIFLTKCNNKSQAAMCYEAGHFYNKAIDLYAELNQQYKVGELERKIGNEERAIKAFGNHVEDMTQQGHYLAAGKVAVEDMYDVELGRSKYLKGWEEATNKVDCLDAFFDTHQEEKSRIAQIETQHQEEFEGQTAHAFIKVLKMQRGKVVDSKDTIERFTYETIARASKKDPSIASAMKDFDRGDLVNQDITRFLRKPQ